MKVYSPKRAVVAKMTIKLHVHGCKEETWKNAGGFVCKTPELHLRMRCVGAEHGGNSCQSNFLVTCYVVSSGGPTVASAGGLGPGRG